MNAQTYKTLRNLKFNEILAKMEKGQNKALTSAYTYELKESTTPFERVKITSPDEAHDYIKNLHDETHTYQESFFVLFLNRANNIIGHQKMSMGTISMCVVDVRYIVKTATSLLASGIILTHNHPSGDLRASEADKKLTREIGRLCEIHKIGLLDHIITTTAGYISMERAGEL